MQAKCIQAHTWMYYKCIRVGECACLGVSVPEKACMRVCVSVCLTVSLLLGECYVSAVCTGVVCKYVRISVPLCASVEILVHVLVCM